MTVTATAWATLMGAQAAPPLQIGADRRMRSYVPVPSLAPLKAYVFDIPSRGP